MLVILLIVDIIETLLLNLQHSLASTPVELWWPYLTIPLHGESLALHVHRGDRRRQMA